MKEGTVSGGISLIRDVSEIRQGADEGGSTMGFVGGGRDRRITTTLLPPT